MNLLADSIEQYISEHSDAESEVLFQLRRETYLKVQMPQMVSGPLQGAFLRSIAAMLQPKRVLEIGTFTGYSAICFAAAMPQDSLLYTLDVNEELAPMANAYFEKAGVKHLVKMLVGDARTIIPSIDETFDLVFIDADKQNYSHYFDLVIDKVRTGGFIIADNVLWSGKVVEEKKDKDTLAIHAYNQKVLADKRVQNFILPIRDGLNIAQKVV